MHSPKKGTKPGYFDLGDALRGNCPEARHEVVVDSPELASFSTWLDEQLQSLEQRWQDCMTRQSMRTVFGR